MKDLEATRHFYHDLLTLPLITLAEGRHVFFRAGSSVLLCFIADKTLQEPELPPHGATGSIHFAFEVEQQEYAAALQTISDSKIPILHHHKWPNGRRSFYFHDPDGNVVEVVEKGLWD